MHHIVTLIFVVLLSINYTFAQNGYDWGTNKPEAQARWQYMNFLVEQQKFNQAVVPLSWLLKNTPNLHVDLYKMATKIYEKVEKNEPNKEYKLALQDTILMAYDKRVSLFGDEANVINRKGLVAYKFLSKRGGMEDSLLNIYQKIYDLNGTKTYANTAYYYMTSGCDAKKKGLIDNEKVLDIYSKTIEVYDLNISAATSEAKKASLSKFKGKLDGKLTQCADVSCEYAIEKWGSSTDLPKLKLAYNILLTKKCTDKPEFIEITSKILEAEPSADGYKSMGDKLAKTNTTKALEFYNKALELESSNDIKAIIYIKMANIYSKTNRSKSRDYAKKAIALGEHTSEAYTLIGNLYIASYDQCKGTNPIETRAIFIAAHNQYKKAGNAAKMKECKANFPSKEEIFSYNKKVGDAVTVGCWVNETVTIQTRD